MARDKGLEQVIHDNLRCLHSITEKAMFGGWAWLHDGNLFCGARDDGMLVRLGKGNDTWALALPGVAPMQSGSRRIQGWVRASPLAYGDDTIRKRLLVAAMEFVRSLPPK